MEAEWFSGIKAVTSTATTVVSGLNDWIAFLQWFQPDKTLENGQLQEELWKLETTMPMMQEMIDKAEWSSHKDPVAKLLEELKGVFYDSEDTLDDLNYYVLKSKKRKVHCQQISLRAQSAVALVK